MFSTIPLYLIGSYYLPSTFITSLCLSLFYYRLVRFHRIKAPDFSSLPLASYSKFCLHFQCTFRPNIYISRIFNVLSLDAELYILASSLVRLLQCNIFKNSAPKPRKSEDVSQNFFHVFVYLWDMLYSIQPCAYMWSSGLELEERNIRVNAKLMKCFLARSRETTGTSCDYLPLRLYELLKLFFFSLLLCT